MLLLLSDFFKSLGAVGEPAIRDYNNFSPFRKKAQISIIICFDGWTPRLNNC